VLGELIAHPHPLRLTDISEHPRSYGFPHGHPPMRSFLGVPIMIDGTPFGNLYLTEKQGGERFSEADEEAVVMLAELAGYAIDHARRYTGASEHRDELERTVAALNATTQIARAVGAETDLDVILELVAKRGRALVDARLLAIELVRRGQLVLSAGAGELPPGLLGQTVPLGESAASAALRTRRSQRLQEPLTRARFDEHGLGTLGVQAKGGLTACTTARSSHPTTSACSRPLPPAPRQRSPPRNRSRPSAAASALPQPRLNASAGRASFTTTPCRASALCAWVSPPPSVRASTRRSSRPSPRRSIISRKASPTCAR
jgi:hypothetical protein